jgi:hypothetical protein
VEAAPDHIENVSLDWREIPTLRYRLAVPVYYFQWPSSQSDSHWVEGPIAQESPRDRPAPGNNPDVLECSGSIVFPYVLFTSDGKAPLVIFK